jgi:uncharacterized protein YndB with AHSA1/START domain
MTGKADSRSIRLEYDLPHPPAKVWRALTEPKLLAAWLMASDAEPVAGRGFTFKMDPTPWWDGIVRCEVLELEQHKRLRYTWQGGTGATRLDTVVTWTLSETPSGGTRLQLEHSGFAPDNKFAFDGADKGWQRNLDQRLRALLAELP